MSTIVPGEDKAWEALSEIDPEDVCRRAGAVFDHGKKTYNLKSFGRVFSVNTEKREISGMNGEGEPFLGRLGYFFRLSLLSYLVKAKEIQPSGNLVKPTDMVGGDIFFRGSHILPLGAVAKKYAKDGDGFTERGVMMGGRGVQYGDASVELYPFPKIPVTLILWLEDEEWEARADLLFDSTGSSHLPLDILWSVAMMSVLIFL